MVSINRVTKVVKGGRNFRFAALVVIGDGKGRVGCGIGKATEIPEAARKATEDAKKHLDALDLTHAPTVVPPAMFPDGVNVEFVVPVGHPGDRHVRMRVFERGVGETLSCGTGAVAVMVAAAARDDAPLETAYDVDVPGGRVRVTRRADSHLELRGPAVLVARGRITA